MWLADLATSLRGQNLEGISDNVYVNALNDRIVTGVMLTSLGVSCDPQLPGYHKGPMQAVVRALDGQQAETLGYAVMDALQGENLVAGDTTFKHIYSRHLPMVFPRSNGDYYEASINFDVCFTRDMA